MLRLTIQWQCEGQQSFNWDAGDFATKAEAAAAAGALRRAAEAGAVSVAPPYLSAPGASGPVAFLGYEIEEFPS